MLGRPILRSVAVAASAVLLVTALAVPAMAADKSICKDGGWQDLYRPDGGTFKNEGQCVKYVVHGGATCDYVFPQDTKIHEYAGDIEEGQHFCGGPGSDIVSGVMYGGIFDGGDGMDVVGDLRGGTFNGGPGDDWVYWHSYGLGRFGIFNGGPGMDWVEVIMNGIFDGGDGWDRVGAYWDIGNAICPNVEDDKGCPES